MKFEPFENIFKDSTSNFTKVKKEDYQNVGAYPIVDQGQAFIGGYTDDENLVVTENLPVIIFGDHTKIFKYVDFPFTIGADGVKVLTLKNKKDNALFYYYFLKSIRIVDKGYSRHFKYLKEKKLPVVDYPDQIHIAKLLSKAEILITQRKESIRLLDEFLKSTFLEMFGDPLINSKQWRIIKIKDCGKIVTGTTPPSSKDGMFGGEIPFITPSDLESDEPNRRFVTELGAENSRTVRKGATFICCIGATIGKVQRAKVLSAFNQQLNAIEWNSDFNDLFGERLMRFMKPRIIGKGGGSTTLPILNKGDFEKLDIIHPPIELQTQFAQIVEKTEALKIQYQQSMQELENLYGSLSQRAFRGELKVIV